MLKGESSNFAKKTHPCAKKNLVPRAVLMKSGLVSVNTARQVNTGHSKTTVNVARPMSYLSRIVHLTDQGVIDNGCSRHMTRNMSYLTDYEEIDGEYIAFRGNPKGGKITGKLIDESQVLLRVPRKNNMYSVDLKNIVPKGGLTCLFAKATSDESKLWHRRLGLPSKLFENDQTCVACQKGKQHRASCKSKTENSISLPLHLLHMDLFGPTFVKSLMKKMYCLVVIDDYSRFTWVFFLATKDETSGILKSFITGIENLVDHKVKVIRCDNGTEFKNREMNQFCKMKGILRQFSVARTTQQNWSADGENRTLIEAARTMLADSKLPTTFWVPLPPTPPLLPSTTPRGGQKLFNTACYNMASGRKNLPVRFSKSIPNAVGSRPDWLFDIDALTRSMNYEPIVAGTKSNGFAGTKASDNAGQARKETEPVKDYILLPLWTADPPYSQDPKSSHNDGSKPSSDDGKKVDEDPRLESEWKNPKKVIHALKESKLDRVYAGKSFYNSSYKKIEAIRLFLAYASFKDFVVYQMDVKSAFLYGKIKEEVYVCQPPGFEDPDFPDRVYKVEKSLYDIHQLLELVYVDDIIFGSTKKELCIAFEKLMHEKFQMSSMGELTFFLGLQVKQKKDGIFISQDKYVEEILKKFGFTEVKTASTPMETQKPLLKDEDGEEVDVHMYRSMIGSLMYLTSSRPDIMFVVCACARYQVNPKVSHLHAVKRIFRLISWQCKKQTVVANSITEAEYVAASSCCGQAEYGSARNRQWVKTINGETQLHALVDGKEIIITEASVRRDL
ncbi:putative ribonuclease H-like domain-containing protein [Tanacetum coccineum]